MGLRRKSKSPAALSHKFVSQNHTDTASYLVMGFLLGVEFQVPAKYAIIFIAVQYNVTYTTDYNSEQFHFYDCAPEDTAAIFFYMLVAINLHAVIQEYILDKINRSLHVSKTKHSKSDESGQLAFFYYCSLFSFIWGASVLNAKEFMMNPTSLWKDCPHSCMHFQVKFFYICQIACWLHALLKLYFQKIRK
ncbi:PREDICTED: LOW QUALITY PROTEIN: translocating chain-associated membrane protein 1-like 1, partial [Mesitornis unicolor]|uniref:LOW QUALITY PROTEIN: translocating chain-associated membrane protein 1-like 1 n=1 Tax=Mesitornis unicolor TaxID=54374 RepID=UPI000528A012